MIQGSPYEGAGHALRLYFLGFYLVSLTVFVAKVIPASIRVTPARRTRGAMRILPPVLVLLDFVLPPLLIFTRAGELDVGWLPVRLLGLATSLYAAVILPWAAATLGRFLVPQAVVVSGHELVTSGPYRFVRHPAYSGDLALLLGAALGTMNWILLLMWPVVVVGAYLQRARRTRYLPQSSAPSTRATRDESAVSCRDSPRPRMSATPAKECERCFAARACAAR